VLITDQQTTTLPTIATFERVTSTRWTSDAPHAPATFPQTSPHQLADGADPFHGGPNTAVMTRFALRLTAPATVSPRATFRFQQC
jgi:hypothetical protein